MALRDQPYLPLYVQDFLTDEKLAECSAEATGVYIRLMCIMHKSEEYGKIILRDKDFCREICRGKNDGKQSGEVDLFAAKLVKHLPYEFEIIRRSLMELIEERVIYIDDKSLCQKRMIHDAKLSETRSLSGKKGAETTNKKFKKETSKKKKEGVNFATAKLSANTEYENEYEIHLSNSNNIDSINKGVIGGNEPEEIISVEAEDDFSMFLNWINNNATTVATMKEPFTREQYERIVEEYSEDDVKHILQQMHNYKPLKSKCISANLTARNWLKRDKCPTLGKHTGQKPTAGKVGSLMQNIEGALNG